MITIRDNKNIIIDSDLLLTFNKSGAEALFVYDPTVKMGVSTVLAWHRERDGRPWLTDKAVCCSKIFGDDNFTHAMGLLARNPSTLDSENWRPYIVCGKNFSWFRLLDRKPTLEEAFSAFNPFFTAKPRNGLERYDSYDNSGVLNGYI